MASFPVHHDTTTCQTLTPGLSRAACGRFVQIFKGQSFLGTTAICWKVVPINYENHPSRWVVPLAKGKQLTFCRTLNGSNGPAWTLEFSTPQHFCFFFFFFVFFFFFCCFFFFLWGGCFWCLFCCFFFLGPLLRHMEVPKLGVESELRLCQPVPRPVQLRIQAASVTYTTTHRNAGSFSPLSKARDHTHILMDISQVCYCWATTGTPCCFALCTIGIL